jgi:hypothetical protein
VQERNHFMWSGFDPELLRQLDNIREMVVLRHQTPTKEWPLIFMDEWDSLLVVRQWPNGAITAYTTSEYSDQIRKKDDRHNGL